MNELSETNHYITDQIVVFADTIKPEIQVSYDGRQIVGGDYVSPQPEILINIYDNSQISVDSDTSKINLFLDNERINYSEGSLKIFPINISAEPRLKARVHFTPVLTDGDHSLEVFVKDVRGNLAYYRDDFQVISEFEILNVFNFPNPFSDGTEFTFHLTAPSEQMMIKMYTVSGRLVRTIERLGLEAGFHRIYWDGLDQDRNIMANGVYLYKVIARSGDKQVEKIEKFVIMR